jgi:PAS domain S-box-containing protein
MKSIPEDQTRIILDSIADGVFTVDHERRITSFNRAAERITGFAREAAVGRYCWEVLRASICEGRCALRKTMDTGQSIIDQSVYIVNAQGERIPVSISTALLRDKEGRVIGGVETFRDLSLLEELRKEITNRYTFRDIISKNPLMQHLFDLVDRVADSNTTVLITGESGTGKELLARAVHHRSPRRNGPLITVNCAALPDTLLESELFGYKAGAFTDAKKDKPGRLALAQGGTLLLDEIGDISPLLQIRLLRFLQDKTYEPLGATAPAQADVRVIAATHRDLEALVREGRFRDDLYYRINVVQLSLPPLRRRKEDIPLLVDHFIRKYNRLNNREIQTVAPEVLAVLMDYAFPGNIRELENIIEHASILCRGCHIEREHLPSHLRLNHLANGDCVLPEDLTLEEMERQMLTQALQRNQWNRKATAAQLGIHPSTLWRRMRRLNLKTPEVDGRFRPPDN